MHFDKLQVTAPHLGMIFRLVGLKLVRYLPYLLYGSTDSCYFFTVLKLLSSRLSNEVSQIPMTEHIRNIHQSARNRPSIFRNFHGSGPQIEFGFALWPDTEHQLTDSDWIRSLLLCPLCWIFFLAIGRHGTLCFGKFGYFDGLPHW